MIFTEILTTRKGILQIERFQKALFENRLVFFNYTVTGRRTILNYPIQGLPATLRKTIEPHNGNIFIVADVSQEEVRILTQIAMDDALLKIFQNNLDFHSY
uniref:DNA-directed DNA polymerase family A palm domain-containing protein n=1 Tax=Pseudocodium devriesii TaxID=453070 RepID=A0A386B140_9CHLO|nr:hypothetical protein [Pseudocodium devriesii]AYC65408.1 hypothetical protein [Pseudocodium devriesii]